MLPRVDSLTSEALLAYTIERRRVRRPPKPERKPGKLTVGRLAKRYNMKEADLTAKILALYGSRLVG